LGAIEFARWTLQQDQNLDVQKKNRVDSLDEPWAMSIPAVPVERGTVVARIGDAQAKFNLNNIGLRKNPDDRAFLEKLFNRLGIPVSLVNALKDWVDKDDEVTLPGGAEDLDYLNLAVPRRAANQALVDVDELNTIKGFNSDYVARLKPYVTALPRATAVNINTASEDVLALVFDISIEEARQLVALRGEKPFQDEPDLMDRTPSNIREKWGKTIGTKEGGAIQFGMDWDVRSDYFMILSSAHYGRVELGLTACVQRVEDRSYPRLIRLRRALVSS
jgi:general secretion pathway protein K